MSATLTETITSFLPVLLIVVTMTGFGWSSRRALPAGWALALVIALIVWDMNLPSALGYSVLGAFKSLDIILIIFGALLVLNTLKESGAFRVICGSFRSISEDGRIQVIIIAWMFSAFLEGASGFGAPAAVAAPLLAGLGVPPMSAVIAALIMNSTPVAFAAAGIPISAAINSLEGLVAGSAAQAAFSISLVRHTALIHGIAGTFIPLLTLFILLRPYGKHEGASPFRSIIPFALFSGLAYTVPSVLIAFFFGPELPALLGALIGLVLVLFAAKKGFLAPREVFSFAPAPLRGEGDGDVPLQNLPGRLISWAPYVLIALILVVTRLPLFGLGPRLSALELRFPVVPGTSEAYSLKWAFLPGIFPFLFVALIQIPLFRMKARSAGRAWKQSLHQTSGAAIALVSGLAFVQLMLHSDLNGSGLPSMITVMAGSLSGVGRLLYIFAAPFIGDLGTFMSGSNTVSNILFSSLQYKTASLLSLPEDIILALQVVGGGIGHMICVHVIVAVCATVGLKEGEGVVLKKNLLPALIYTLAAGTAGFIIIVLRGI